MKCMCLVGAMDVPEETSDPNVLTWSWAPLSEEHGGWQWHIIDVMDLQFELNANNTVMRSCNFKDKKVMETGDISANMSFFLAKEDEHGGSSVAPGFHPHRVDRTVEWHDEMQRLFDEKNVFRGVHEKPITVTFTAKFTEVREVETMLERFGASVEVTMSWPVTRVDAADWVAATDRRRWVPASFIPPEMEVENSSTSKGAEPVRVTPGRCKLRVNNQNRVVVIRRIQFRGDFYEPFELQAYPFDVQPLKLVLRTPRERPLRESSCNFVYLNTEGKHPQEIVPRDTEWRHNTSSAGCRFIPEGTDDMEKADLIRGPEKSLEIGKSISRATIFGRRSTIYGQGPNKKVGVANRATGPQRFESMSVDPHGIFELTVEVVVERLYMVHVIRVVLVLALFSLTSISALCEDDDVNALDRLALLVTLMLTSATYSLVVKGDIPALGYVTLVDTYVLCTFSFIALVVMQVTTLEWIYPDGDGMLDNGTRYDNGNFKMNMIAKIDVCLWTVLHLSMFLYTSCRVLPNERRKTDVIVGDSLNRTAAAKALKAADAHRKAKVKGKRKAKGKGKVKPDSECALSSASDIEDLTDAEHDGDGSSVRGTAGNASLNASAGDLPFPKSPTDLNHPSSSASELFQNERSSPDADNMHGASLFGSSPQRRESSVSTTGIWQTTGRKLSGLRGERPLTADLVVRAVSAMSVAAHEKARERSDSPAASSGLLPVPKASAKEELPYASPKSSPYKSPTTKRKVAGKMKQGTTKGGQGTPKKMDLKQKLSNNTAASIEGDATTYFSNQSDSSLKPAEVS